MTESNTVNTLSITKHESLVHWSENNTSWTSIFRRLLMQGSYWKKSHHYASYIGSYPVQRIHFHIGLKLYYSDGSAWNQYSGKEINSGNRSSQHSWKWVLSKNKQNSVRLLVTLQHSMLRALLDNLVSSSLLPWILPERVFPGFYHTKKVK